MILTNGMLLAGRRLETLRSLSGERVTLQISVDSPTPERHDRHRGEGTWARAWLLLKAARLLLVPRDRVGIGPSLDGGYYFIGIRRTHAELFHAIDWSTERVAEQTRQRAFDLGLEALDLDAWYDIDDAHSLQQLVYELAPDETVNSATPYPAPVTRAFLEQNALAARLASSGVTVLPPPAGLSTRDTRPKRAAARKSARWRGSRKCCLEAK